MSTKKLIFSGVRVLKIVQSYLFRFGLLFWDYAGNPQPRRFCTTILSLGSKRMSSGSLKSTFMSLATHFTKKSQKLSLSKSTTWAANFLDFVATFECLYCDLECDFCDPFSNLFFFQNQIMFVKLNYFVNLLRKMSPKTSLFDT